MTSFIGEKQYCLYTWYNITLMQTYCIATWVVGLSACGLGLHLSSMFRIGCHLFGQTLRERHMCRYSPNKYDNDEGKVYWGSY